MWTTQKYRDEYKILKIERHICVVLLNVSNVPFWMLHSLSKFRFQLKFNHHVYTYTLYALSSRIVIKWSVWSNGFMSFDYDKQFKKCLCNWTILCVQCTVVNSTLKIIINRKIAFAESVTFVKWMILFYYHCTSNLKSTINEDVIIWKINML